MSRKVFTAGEVLAAADVNSFLMDQSVMSFAGTAARGSAIPTPVEGMYTHLEDSDLLQFWNGSAWTLANRAATGTGTSGYTVIATSWTDYITVTITCSGRPVFVNWNANHLNANSGANRTVGFRALQDGTQIGLGVGNIYSGLNETNLSSEGILVTPAAGSRTFKLQAIASNASSVVINNAALNVFEM